MKNFTTPTTVGQQQTFQHTKCLLSDTHTPPIDPKRLGACMLAALRILKENQPATATAENAGAS